MADTDILKVSILGKESIHCGFHLIPYIAQTVLATLPSSTYVLITDTNIAKLHLAEFEQEFERAVDATIANPKPRFLTHVIPPGETSKSRDGKASIEDFLLLNRCTRDSVILALGGGVIGDLVGFVAATLYVWHGPCSTRGSGFRAHRILQSSQHAWCQVLPNPYHLTRHG